MRSAMVVAGAMLAACRPADPPPAPPPPPALAQIDARVARILAEDRIPGAVVLAGEGQRVLHRKAYGEARLDTLFDLASVTKVVGTTTAALKLVEEGRLSLDDPLGKFLPCFAGREIRLRDLLTHRSRLPAYLKPRSSTPEAILEEFAALPPEEKEYTYS